MTTNSTAPSPVSTPVAQTPATPAAKAQKPAKTVTAKTVIAKAAKPVKKAEVAKSHAATKTVAASKPSKAAPMVKPEKVSDNKDSKAKKPKLVRDSFTIPKDEYNVLDTLKQRAAALAHPVKKSELLRAGLKLLGGLSDTALRNALQAVPSIKTGRPKAETVVSTPTASVKPEANAKGRRK